MIQDWVQDKVSSCFAFPALCQEKSFIPLEVWQAADETTNVIESGHLDSIRDGKDLSLVGGVLQAKNYDLEKLEVYKVSLECDNSGEIAGDISRTAFI